MKLRSTLGLFLLSYFRFFAKLQLRKNRRAITIGITGSYGKTSGRLALYTILSSRARVKHSRHANSETGLPLNILGLQAHTYSSLDWLRLALFAPLKLLTNWEKYDYYIAEMGVDSPLPPKNMQYLLTILRPEVGIILNAAPVHTQAFDSLVLDREPARKLAKLTSAIAREKFKLALSVDSKGLVVAPIGQKEFAEYFAKVQARLLTFGKSSSATLRIISSHLSVKGYLTKFSYQGNIYSLALKDIAPPGFSDTLLACVLTAAGLGVPVSHSLSALSDYRPPKGRMRLFSGKNDSHIIDSSYNANPATMLEALKVLHQLAGRKRKIAVLGDMQELGTLSKSSHKALASQIVKYADQAILYGEETAKHTFPLLEKMNFPVRHFTDFPSLAKELSLLSKPGSWFLVKGSQNKIYLERAVEVLLKDKKDIANLCRRGKYWDRRRK